MTEAAPWLAAAAILGAWYLDSRRRDAQVDSILARVGSTPRLVMERPEQPPQPNLDARRYIADHEADDAAWNEFRGEPQEDDE